MTCDLHSVEEVKASAEAVVVTPETKVVSGAKSVGRKTVVRTRRVVAKRTPKSGQAVKAKANEEAVEVKDSESPKKVEPAVGQSSKKEENVSKVVEQPVVVVDNVEESEKEEETSVQDVEEFAMEEETAMEVELRRTDFVSQGEPVVSEIAKSSENEQASGSKKGEEMNEQSKEDKMKIVDDEEDSEIEPVMMEENSKNELEGEEAQREHDEYGGDEGLEEYGDRVDFGDHDEDELAEEDPEEPADETETLDEEHRELTAAAKERRIKKEHEIFVGGLDRDAREEDVRKVFEKMGEVVEVRLHINFATNKNKGYAFVKFANKEHAKRALLEMKNPLV